MNIFPKLHAVGLYIFNKTNKKIQDLFTYKAVFVP